MSKIRARLTIFPENPRGGNPIGLLSVIQYSMRIIESRLPTNKDIYIRKNEVYESKTVIQCVMSYVQYMINWQLIEFRIEHRRPHR